MRGLCAPAGETIVDWTLNPEALRLYFQFRYIPEPFTPFLAVTKLPAAHWMRYDVNTGKLEQQRYWRLPAPSEEDPAKFNEAKLCEELRVRFDEAVKMRMLADVPLGAFLSGGIDSSSVVASMALQSKEPVKTFSRSAAPVTKSAPTPRTRSVRC